MSGPSSGRRTSCADRDRCDRGEESGSVTENMGEMGIREAGRSAGSARSSGGCRTRENLAPPSASDEGERGSTASDSNIPCGRIDVSSGGLTSPIGREDDYGARKGVEGNGCESSGNERELREVLLRRLEDIVKEMRELNVLKS